MAQTLTRTLCQYCGAPTMVAGWETCNTCETQDVHYIPIIDIADVIMGMDMVGMPEAARQAHFKQFGVTPMQVAAAQEEVESRYKAAHGALPGVPRWRKRYRRWHG